MTESKSSKHDIELEFDINRDEDLSITNTNHDGFFSATSELLSYASTLEGRTSSYNDLSFISYGSMPSVITQGHVYPHSEVVSGSKSLGLGSENPEKSKFEITSTMTNIEICAILSTAFSYGCIMSTLFLLVLPIECQRIQHSTTTHVSKSLALGGFAVIAGLSQLVTPVVGMLSDHFEVNGEYYPELKKMGKRMPYLLLGSLMVASGNLGQGYFSGIEPSEWSMYTCAFTIHMLGINVVYVVMIALIPDLVPDAQIGVANGLLALMSVSGSLFGFTSFHLILNQNVNIMYQLYVFVSVITAFLTFLFVRRREEQVEKEKRDYEDEVNINTSDIISNYDEQIDSKSHDDCDLLNTSEYTYLHKNSQKIKLEEVSRESSSKQEKNSNTEHSFWPAPHVLLYMMLYEPIKDRSHAEIRSAYWIDATLHYDFLIVTISRLFYYMGISCQTFFLYFIHDEIHVESSLVKLAVDPAAAVSMLAIIAQIAGAITCYPIGYISDKYFEKKRKPFVYLACLILSTAYISMLFCNTLDQMSIVVIFFGAANGMYLTMDTSLAVDTLPDDNDIAAQLLGVWGVFGFIGSACGPLIGGLILFFVGKKGLSHSLELHKNIEDSNSDENYYNFIGYIGLMCISALYFIISAASLSFVKKKGV
mmetsp:Transcript_21861/g.30719  ORF Transcript_21861/g.30719 Transcript_21861/m.30719 type:complete len:649 (+) Transcript_21861:30-1976(+)